MPSHDTTDRVAAVRLQPAAFDVAALRRLPAAEELASDLLLVDPLDPEFAAPAITNQWSGLVAAREPFAYAGFSSPAIYHEGLQAELFIGLDGGGLRPAVEVFGELGYRWFPSRIERSGEADGLAVRVDTRLSTRAQVVLNRLALQNTGTAERHVDLFVRVLADLRSTWLSSWPPEDTAWATLAFDAGRGALALAGPEGDSFALVGGNRRPLAAGGFGGRRSPEEVEDDPAWSQALQDASLEAYGGDLAGRRQGVLHYRAILAPGQAFDLDWVHAIAATAQEAAVAFDEHLADFATVQEEVRQGWEEEWRAAFQPPAPGGRRRFSGYAPVVSSANPKLQRLYHMGLMTLLQCKRTPSFGGEAQVYITGFPSSLFTFAINWAFPWDTKMIAGILSLLDPLAFRRMIVAWLHADLHQGCAIDFTTGKPVGFWYAVNDYALVHMVWQYLRYTGDDAFLAEEVRGQSVLDHLLTAARYYQRIADADGLADYGGAENLLECVSTYTHKVASFNAANVWNLRTVAQMLGQAGRSEEAAELRALADALVPAIQQLYVPGDGVFSCLQPDGRKVVVRHCLDFHTVAQCLAEDLSAQQKQEMVAFFLRELKTETWMHALSPLDPDTAHSSRTDHQDEGAYTTWPAYAFEVLMAEGFEAEAMAWLGDEDRPGFADVTKQGAFGQAYNHGDEGSHRLAGAGAKAPMEMPHIEKPTLVSGGKYAQIVLEAVLGLEPALFGEAMVRPRRHGTRLDVANLWLHGRNQALAAGADRD